MNRLIYCFKEDTNQTENPHCLHIRRNSHFVFYHPYETKNHLQTTHTHNVFSEEYTRIRSDTQTHQIMISLSLSLSLALSLSLLVCVYASLSLYLSVFMRLSLSLYSSVFMRISFSLSLSLSHTHTIRHQIKSSFHLVKWLLS